MGGTVPSAATEETAKRWRAGAWLKDSARQVWDYTIGHWRPLALCVGAWALAGGFVLGGERLGLTPQCTVILAGVFAAFGLLQLGRFLPADWFLAFLLCATAAFYFGVIAYQAQVRDYTAREQKSIYFAGDAQESTALGISYPKTIPLEEADKPGWPLSVYFRPPVSEAGMSATGPFTCVVSLTAADQNVIDFTDKDGVPLPPRITVSPYGEAEPSALYVRQNAAVPRSLPVTVTVAITVHVASGQPVALLDSDSGSPTLEFVLEDARNAWRRHFLALLLGPTTPFIVVAGSVVTLAVWWWQEEQKRRREQEKAIGEIRHVRQLAEKCRAAVSPTEHKSHLEQTERELDEVRKNYDAVPELQDELRRSTEAVRWAQLEHIRSIVAEDWAGAASQYRNLEATKDAEKWKDVGLLSLLWDVRVMINQLSPPSGPPEIPAVAAWVEAKDLRFNPFGPEKAEDDPYFHQRCVEPPGWDALSRGAPTIIVGAPGSGRTAARLYLTHYCDEHSLASSGGRPDTLVVPVEWPPEDPASEAAVAWRKALAAAIAEANLKQLARRPDLLDITPFRQQQALAVLFWLTRDVIGDSGVYLERHGLEQPRAKEIARLVRRLSRYVALPSYDAEDRIVGLLEQARLAPFSQYFVCIEVPDDAPDGEPSPEVQVHLQVLGKMMASFAKGAVFLKVFIQPKWARLLQVSNFVPHAKLEWKEDQLKKLLHQQLVAAGAAEDIRSLFPSVKRDLEGPLVAAACGVAGAPRELIRLGNALVREDAANPPLTWEKVQQLLGARGGGQP